MKDEQFVTERAKDLARRLGGGWRPEIWENLGWHYKAVHDGAQIAVYANHDDGRENGRVTYWADYGGGSYPDAKGRQLCSDGKSTLPSDAVRQIIVAALEQAANYNAVALALIEARPVTESEVPRLRVLRASTTKRRRIAS